MGAISKYAYYECVNEKCTSYGIPRYVVELDEPKKPDPISRNGGTKPTTSAVPDDKFCDCGEKMVYSQSIGFPKIRKRPG